MKLKDDIFRRQIAKLRMDSRPIYITVTREVNGYAVFAELPPQQHGGWSTTQFLHWENTRDAAILYGASVQSQQNGLLYNFLARFSLQ